MVISLVDRVREVGSQSETEFGLNDCFGLWKSSMETSFCVYFELGS